MSIKSNEPSEQTGFVCTECRTPISSVVPEPPTSPITRTFVHPNEALSVEEGQVVRRSISTAEHALQSIAATEEQLKQSLELCRSSRKAHKKFIKHHKRLLHRPHWLPAELWAEIFGYATLWAFKYAESFTETCPPFSVSHVCTLWREVALETPSLWCYIRLSDFQLSSSNVELLSLYLDRGHSSPLHIKFLSEGHSIYEVKKKIYTTVELLSKHATRWRTADLTLSGDLLRSNVFPLTDTPILETISISTTVSDSWLESEVDWQPSFLTYAPQLTRAVLDGFDLGSFETFQKMLPLQALTTVKLKSEDSTVGSSLESDDILNVLRGCPELRKLDCTRPSREANKDIAPFTHHRLEELCLYEIPTILSLLTAPNLRHLEIQDADVDLRDVLRKFILRSSGLKSLRLTDSDIAFLSRLEDCSIQNLEMELCYEDYSKLAKDFFSLAKSYRLAFVNVQKLFIQTYLSAKAMDRQQLALTGPKTLPQAIIDLAKAGLLGRSNDTTKDVTVEIHHYAGKPQALFDELKSHGELIQETSESGHHIMFRYSLP